MGTQRPAWKFVGDDVAILLEHVTKQSAGTSNDPDGTEAARISSPGSGKSPGLAAFPFAIKQGPNVREAVLAHQTQQLLIDQQLVLRQQELLQEPRTKIISTPWLLYFLDQEFFRQTSCGIPFALVLMSLSFRATTERTPLPVGTLRDVSRCISTAIRRIDLFVTSETTSTRCSCPTLTRRRQSWWRRESTLC